MRPDLFFLFCKKPYLWFVLSYMQRTGKGGGGRRDSNSISTNLPPWLQMRSPLCSRLLLLEG